ncbi:MAG: hypothetical protein JWQ95_6968 [Sphaerisporangium sp.]|nr:hypothetical protein [Sphaerisporangium sp.]
MRFMANSRTGPAGELPDSRLASLLRAAIELIAWIVTPGALWEISVPLALLSLILLLGLSTVFTTFSGKAHGVVRVPGLVTIALFVHVAAAVIPPGCSCPSPPRSWSAPSRWPA